MGGEDEDQVGDAMVVRADETVVEEVTARADELVVGADEGDAMVVRAYETVGEEVTATSDELVVGADETDDETDVDDEDPAGAPTAEEGDPGTFLDEQ